jgi:hypothetical protein
MNEYLKAGLFILAIFVGTILLFVVMMVIIVYILNPLQMYC